LGGGNGRIGGQRNEVTPVHPGEEKELEMVGVKHQRRKYDKQNNDQAYSKFRWEIRSNDRTGTVEEA